MGPHADLLWAVRAPGFSLCESPARCPRGKALGPRRTTVETGSGQRARAAEVVGGAGSRRGPFPDLLGLRCLCREFLLEPDSGIVPVLADPIPRPGPVGARGAGGVRRARPGGAGGGCRAPLL